MKDSKEHNLEGFGCLGWGLLAIAAAPAILCLSMIPYSGEGDSEMYWSVPLGLALFYAPFFWLFKWAYSRHLKIWSSAADSLGLLLSRKFGWPGWFYYSLEGEYKGYSIRVYQVSAIKGGSLMYILKCPESLRQRVKDGEIGGVVGTLQGKSRPWYAPPLPDGYEVFVEAVLPPPKSPHSNFLDKWKNFLSLSSLEEEFVEAGDFRFRQIGWFIDIASAVEQMADLVARLEDSPLTPPHLPEPPSDE